MYRLMLAALAALTLAGCASTMDPYAAQVEIAKHRAAEAKHYSDTMWQIAQDGDTTVRTVAAVMLGAKMQAAGTGQGFQYVPDRAIQLVGALAGPVASVGLGYVSMRQGIAATEAQRDIGISTNQAFAAFGESIGSAATAGYQWIQAPAPNVGGSIVGGDQYGDYSGERSGNSGTIAGRDWVRTTTNETPQPALEM